MNRDYLWWDFEIQLVAIENYVSSKWLQQYCLVDILSFLRGWGEGSTIDDIGLCDLCACHETTYCGKPRQEEI